MKIIGNKSCFHLENTVRCGQNGIRMRKVTSYYKRLKITYIHTALFIITIAALFLPNFTRFDKTGDNWFAIKVNGSQVGVVGDTGELQDYVLEARKKIAQETGELVFIDVDIQTEGREVLWGKIDPKEQVLSNIEQVMRAGIKETMHRSYTVKVNEYTVNLASIDEVKQLLQASIDKFATEDKFEVELVLDSTREFNVLTTHMAQKQDEEEEAAAETDMQNVGTGGIIAAMNEMFDETEPAREKDWDDFEYGLMSIDFGDEVEVVESYLPESQITPLAAAIEEVTKDQEKNTLYEVVSGDTLSGISLSTNIPLDRLIEMNENLENENSIIRVGDELIITIPEPELSVERKEELYYEEEYDEDVIYIDNDDWFTTDSVTRQEPSAGFRRVVAEVSFRNEKEVSRDIIKEEVVMEAVPKIVERGTKIPPSYIKPLSGGRQSSGFGRRKAPTRGASSYHRGIDWATPTGTAVFASSGGTVTKAGWGGGYGYVVYISHADGRQTRYAHLSKVLVKSGQSVSQGQRIALSGNTGISSGPHLHFEMLINGTQVNPLNYLNK